MSLTAWLLAAWLVADLILLLIGIGVIVLGGIIRERENRILGRDVARRLLQRVHDDRRRRARAAALVELEDDAAQIRERRARH